MMKRRIALVFLFFATLMLATHAVLPHHHHCHEVVFLKACDLTGESYEEAIPEFIPQEGNNEHDCTPMPSSDTDPCWQNIQYISEEHGDMAFSVPSNGFLPFSLFLVSYSCFSFVPMISEQSLFVPRHALSYTILFPAGIFGLRAPPLC